MNGMIAEVLIFLAKIWGRVWIHVATPFRETARHEVQNYVLYHQRRDWLKRLWERNPRWDPENFGWVLFDIHEVGENGFVHSTTPCSRFMFYFWVFLVWGWLDDDSNHDTTDMGYVKSLTDGTRRTFWGLIFQKFFRDIVDMADVNFPKYGNTFDLGDKRGRWPFHTIPTTIVWNNRNTAMNFQYLWMNY